MISSSSKLARKNLAFRHNKKICSAKFRCDETEQRINCRKKFLNVKEFLSAEKKANFKRQSVMEGRVLNLTCGRGPPNTDGLYLVSVFLVCFILTSISGVAPHLAGY